MSNFSHIARNIESINEQIYQAATRSGRNPTDVRLIAVTKTYPTDAVIAAVRAGMTDAGENRIQEAVPKIEELSDHPETAGLRWHLIGRLQTNKARQAVQNFDMIHSVDSERLAREINKHALNAGQTKPVLLQINVSGEETKAGFTVEEVRRVLPSILEQYEALEIHGFMTMAPLDDPEAARPVFRGLRELRDSLLTDIQHQRFPGEELSMGMSNDFAVAIEEGSTMIRIGTAIFGQRDYA